MNDTQPLPEPASNPSPTSRIPFDSINEPGAYVCHWSGHLLRVPNDGVKTGRSPVVTLVGDEPLFVTKIAANPYITRTGARLAAANADVTINF